MKLTLSSFLPHFFLRALQVTTLYGASLHLSPWGCSRDRVHGDLWDTQLLISRVLSCWTQGLMPAGCHGAARGPFPRQLVVRLPKALCQRFPRPRAVPLPSQTEIERASGNFQGHCHQSGA